VLEESLAEGGREMGLDLDQEKMKLFRQYYEFLSEGNKRYNLTSLEGEREVAVKHFLDSLSCLRLLTGEKGPLVDVGAGAGFPGLPIKICRPDLSLLLLDSVKKKVEFMSALIVKLGLQGAGARWDRAENLGSGGEFREKAGLVTSRAVAPLNVLAEICLPLVRQGGGFLSMKGPGAAEELEKAKKAIDLLGGSLERVEGLRLPIIPEERTLILIRKTAPTPAGYPRRPGMPAKRPIA